MSANRKSRCRQYRKWLSKSPVLESGIAGGGWRNCLRDMDEEIIRNVTTCVLAPALSSFVLWVLQEAERKEIRRLYFLARDGYFMYRCAVILCEQLGLDIDCRYLYCSRYSLRVPFYHLNRQDAMEYICRGGIDVTRRKIIERSGIDRKKQQEILSILDYSEIADEVVPYPMLKKIRRELEQCESFQEAVAENSRQEMPRLKQYLIQEGLLEKTSYALVDSGWVGSMQKTLGDILRYLGYTAELRGYYWGLYELPAGVRKENYHCYYFSPGRGLREKVYFSNCLFEAIFSAPHGMTVGYRTEGERMVPVLEAFSEERKAFLKKTEHYLMQYAEGLGNALRQEQYPKQQEASPFKRRKKSGRRSSTKRDLRIVKKLIAAFMGHPTREEAGVYGKLRFSDDIMDDAKKQVAEPLDADELKANHVVNKALNMLGIRHDYIKESAWYEGSAALYGVDVRKHQRQYAMYKRLLYIRQSYLKKRK